MNGEKRKFTFKQTVYISARAYRMIKEACPGFLSLTAALAGIDALKPLIALFMSARVLNELAGGRDIRHIVIYAAFTVLSAFVLSAIGAFLQRRLSLIEEYNINAFEFMYAKRYMEFDFKHVEDSGVNQSLADIRARANGNWLGILVYTSDTRGMIKDAVTLLVSLLLLAGMFGTAGGYTRNWVTSPAAALLPAALVAVNLTAPLFIRKISKSALDMIKRENPKANTLFDFYSEYKSPRNAAKDIRLYNQAPALREIFDRRLNLKMWFWFYSRLALAGGLSGLAGAFSGGAVYLFIGLRALYGMYPVGSVVQYVGAVTNFINTISSLTDNFGQILNNLPYMQDIIEFMDNSTPESGGERLDLGGEIAIEFENVSFKYPNTNTYALKNLNLRFRPGRRLAVVGMNGSGKTTMVKLLCRLYEPTEGIIKLNGKDIREYARADYINLFNVVFQDFKLFSLTLGANVAASETYDGGKVQDALLTAGFGRLNSLCKGLGTFINKDCDDDGVQFSGGEQQKIAIARAIYRNAPFAVFDEPTAALDPISEYEVYTKLNDIVGGKTAVFISHRLSSCRFCDDIAVFHEGRLAQYGPHDALLADAGGKYAELWNAQAQYYNNENNRENAV